MILGKCPLCGNNIEVRKKEVQGKKVELYACEKAKWITFDGELFELSKDSTCGFRIWQNALKQYGCILKQNQIRDLLNQEDVIIEIKMNKKKFKKYIGLDSDYGVTILFEHNIQED